MKRLERDRAFYSNDKISLELQDPELLLTANSFNQYGKNDGAMWQGKGLNGRLQAGISFRSKFVDITFYPQIWFAQNLEYEILPGINPSPYSSFFGNIDLAQRMGDEPLFEFDFGQTDIRFNFWKFTFGFSTEEIWLGPGRINGLILSNNSAGLPHFDLGFKKIDTKIGSVEGRFLWGLLRESDYFNDDSSDDLRLFSSASIAWNFVWIPGFNIGLNWSAQTPGGNFEARDFFVIPLTFLRQAESNETNDNDQKYSITLDWKFPDSGFEFYGEFAFEDFNGGGTHTPDHTLFYTLGGFYVVPFSQQRGFIVNFEHTNMGVSDSQELIWDTQATPDYYTHHRVVHGYGNLGQVLGASIGPGSDSQFGSLTYYDFWGSAELFVMRHNKDKTYIYNDVNNDTGMINVELSFGLNGLIFLGPFDLNAGFVVVSEISNLYIEGNDEWNFHGELGLRYRY
ncbi:MAG: hypothetical protein JXR86_03555 [Spirochaetales bacterium]|nr:hypothetical protein [Spirochaetales bacterium]